MEGVTIKLVKLPKLRKEIGHVDFPFKKWVEAVHTRWERELVSYDLKGNKVECPFKSNGDTKIFVGYLNKENGDKHVRHSHKDKGEDTQGIYVTMT